MLLARPHGTSVKAAGKKKADTQLEVSPEPDMQGKTQFL